MNPIMINKEKRIGKVIFIVEGEETEPALISHIFGELFQFNVVIRNKKGLLELKKKEDKYSFVYIIQAEYPQINKLDESDDFLDSIYHRLAIDYELDVENAAIYYIFDRDRKCNRPKVICELLDRYSNSREAKDNEMQGLFLLSYPCIEAFLAHANQKEEPMSCGKEAKEKTKDFKIAEIREEHLERVVYFFLKFCENITKFAFSIYELDNFSKRNHMIFDLEEERYLKEKNYHTLSLLIIALFDLDLISLNDE